MKTQHLYLGNKYKTLITYAESPKIIFNKNTISIQAYNRLEASSLLDQWYRKNALKLFNSRALKLQKKLNLQIKPKLMLRKMSSSWGTCSSDGEIKLNPILIKAPLKYIDYVIMHELCHLIEFNHSASFWNLMKKVMPDYKSRKDSLDKNYNIAKLIF